jgi:RNA polymerase sigma factor (sigma-70 family)
MTQQRPWFEVVGECQEAIVRIRRVLTLGGDETPTIRADLGFVVLAMRNYFLGQHRLFAGASEEEIDDALFRLITQFYKDVRSPGFNSIATKFGSYVEKGTKRALYKARNLAKQVALSEHVSLETSVRQGELTLGQQLADTSHEHFIAMYQDEQLRVRLDHAIAGLPDEERQVITMYLNNVPGKEMARQLQKSEPTISRIKNRAIDLLRQQLTTEGE